MIEIIALFGFASVLVTVYLVVMAWFSAEEATSLYELEHAGEIISSENIRRIEEFEAKRAKVLQKNDPTIPARLFRDTYFVSAHIPPFGTFADTYYPDGGTTYDPDTGTRKTDK